MIKTDEQKVYNDSDLFLSQLNLKLNDKFIEFVHSANKESYENMSRSRGVNSRHEIDEQ